MMYLLDRLYDLPEEGGTISIGGTDIRKIKLEHLRRNIGIVLQEPFLFSRTLRENIGITVPDLQEEELRTAARAACLDDTIQAFTKGYDTAVGERGVTLSGGQKQRAAIARMLTRPTPIMIFDDSLSAVDTETDRAIREALKDGRSLNGRTPTTFIISHRLTTLADADLILVLEDGVIAQQGRHEELIRQEGLYQKVYRIQAALEEELKHVV